MDLWHRITLGSVVGLLLLFFGIFWWYYRIYHKKPAVPFWFMRYFTMCHDYVFFWWTFYCCDYLIGHDNIFQDDAFLPVSWSTHSFKQMLVPNILTCSIFFCLIGALVVREFYLAYFFSDKIAKVKCDYLKRCIYDWNLLFWINTSGTYGACFTILMTISGFLYWDEILLDWISFYTVLCEFHIMIIFKDLVAFRILHHYVLHNSSFNLWHHIHHSYQRETCTITTNITHPADIAVQNTFGPFLLLLAKFIVLSIIEGKPTQPTIHFAAFLFTLLYDFATHSANPYSVVYFNPILDYLLLPAVAHSLHHLEKETRERRGKEWEGCIAYSHLDWMWGKESREEDIRIYNEEFNTEFRWDDMPHHFHGIKTSIIARLSLEPKVNHEEPAAVEDFENKNKIQVATNIGEAVQTEI